MKNTIFTLLFLITINLFSQKGKVIYNAHLALNEKEELLLETTNSDTNDVTCELIFNKNLSQFKKIKKLNPTSINLTSVKIPSGFFYYNKKETVNQRDLFGETYMITLEKINWELSNETKIIDGYQCKKATTIEIKEGSQGVIKKEVIAWYAPEIPLNFGPLNYNGLPGLVLYLQIGNLSLSATNIDLNPKEEISIAIPTEGKHITYNEKIKIIKDMLNKRRKKYRERK